MSRQAEVWSYSIGERRHREGGAVTVRVYERSPGGRLYLALWDPAAREGQGGYRRLSLGHSDRRKARLRADEVYAELVTGRRPDAERAAPSLGAVVELYLKREGGKLKPGTLKWLPLALRSWVELFGADTRADELGAQEWREYLEKRLVGAIDGHGRAVPPGERRPVTPGTVCLCLDAINAAMNWAVTFRTDNRHRLLRENPFTGLKYPANPNVHRPVWTEERLAKILEAAEGVTMQVEWGGRRERMPCYLADVLVVAAESGRRIGAVRQLRAGDLRLAETSPGAPFGRIIWPASTDKKGKMWSAPVSRALRERLLGVLRARGALSGDAYLFPSPRNSAEPVGRETLAVWLREAERRAAVERLGHDTFHGLRRKWATERRHLPDTDVAAAGGWASQNVMKRAYQRADDAGVLEAVLSPRRLHGAAGGAS
jgi:integrase